MAVLIFGAVPAFAQVTPTPTLPPPDDTPNVRVGGLLYADFTQTIAPTIVDAGGAVVSPTAFNVTRAYVNVTGQLNHLFAFRITPDIARETGSGNSLASQKEQLNDLLGRDIRTDFSVAEVPEATTIEASLDAAQAQALSARPELAEARLTVQQAELNRRITKTQYIPDVSLAVTNLSLTNINLLPSYVATAGVLVSWDPIDWGRRKHELAAASKTIEQSKNSANETEAQILVEVAAKFRKLGETRALLHATTLQRDAEREKLRVVRNQFEQKTALLKDVLQQKMSLEMVTNQYNQALLSFWTAKADFEKSLGEE